MKFKKKLRTELLPYYKKILDNFTSNISKEDIDHCAVFYTQWGKDFPTEPHKGIMFYGRATNGWGDINNALEKECLFKEGGELSNFNSKRQIKWIEDNDNPSYNTNRSQMLSTIKKVSSYFYKDNWFNYVAWSNLYKVAPDDQGNPNGQLCNLELQECKDIFRKEIELFSPKFVILLTGDSWYKDFLPEPEQKPIKEIDWGNYTLSVYQSGKTYYLATEHPQGKPYSQLIEKLIEFIKARER
jgi:hypothetical protein